MDNRLIEQTAIEVFKLGLIIGLVIGGIIGGGVLAVMVLS